MAQPIRFLRKLRLVTKSVFILNEKDITNVCILVALVGIVIIYLADINLDPLQVTGAEITNALVGEKVLLCGEIISAGSSEKGTFFLKIDDGTKTDVVLFQSRATKENIKNIEKGKQVCVTGTVAEYRDALEIIATKVSAS